MEVETAKPPSTSGSSSAAYPYPRWVTLERYCKTNAGGDSSSFPTAVTKTLAAARTSHGHPIQVSLSLAEPPATSALLVDLPAGGVDLNYSIIMAAHRDYLLLIVVHYKPEPDDYFVYGVGDAARPPSLLLLPRPYLSESQDHHCTVGYPGFLSDPVNRRQLHSNGTGILHPAPAAGRREDEVVVAELRMVSSASSEDTPKPKSAELFMFRSGAWSVKRPRICCAGDDDEQGEALSNWRTTGVFPIGDRILCWVDETSDNGGGGVLTCDVLEESPCLRYLPLPPVLAPCFSREGCATAGGGALKFVNIFPRCCCGGAGASACQRSRHAYTIHTWTLRMDDDSMDMEWVMDGMVDATELWSLHTYKGLPRVPLGHPVVSIYEPHVICFSLCEGYHVKNGGDETLWMLMVDMRSKTIKSVSRHPDWLPGRVLISSNVSDYLNPYPTCSGDATSMDQSLTSDMDNEKKKRDDDDDDDDDDDGTDSMLRSPCMSTRTEPAAQASEILAAFQEIPSYGLARDDMLKAYAILSNDNGCRVRSLLRLPMKVRKDWLLMEIKADDA